MDIFNAIKHKSNKFNLVVLKNASLTFFLSVILNFSLIQIYLFLSDNFLQVDLLFIVFLVTILLGLAFGSVWWGRLIEGEVSIAPNLLIFMLFLSAIAFLLSPWIIILFGKINDLIFHHNYVSNWLQGANDFSASALFPEKFNHFSCPERTSAFYGLILPLIFAILPFTFILSGYLPIISEVWFKNKLGISCNLSRLLSFWSAGLLFSLYITNMAIERWSSLDNFFLLPSMFKVNIFWSMALFLLPLTAFILIWYKLIIKNKRVINKNKKKFFRPQLSIRFWPVKSIALWNDIHAYSGLIVDSSHINKKIICLMVFIAGFLTLGLNVLLIEKHYDFFNLYGKTLFGCFVIINSFALVLSAIFLLPLLLRLFRPIWAASTALLFIAIILITIFYGLGNTSIYSSSPIYGIALFVSILFAMALYPISALILYNDKHCMASAIGLTSFNFFLGSLFGLIFNRFMIFAGSNAILWYLFAAALGVFLGFFKLYKAVYTVLVVSFFYMFLNAYI